MKATMPQRGDCTCRYKIILDKDDSKIPYYTLLKMIKNNEIERNGLQFIDDKYKMWKWDEDIKGFIYLNTDDRYDDYQNSSYYRERENGGIEEVHRLLRRAGDRYEDEDGFTHISQAGAYIKRVKPDFDVRTYNYKKLSDLISSFPKKYEIRRDKSSFYYRCK